MKANTKFQPQFARTAASVNECPSGRRARVALELSESSRPRRASFKDLGVTPLASQLDLKDEQTFGHWCSRCSGIWFGMCLEVQCPVCGNRGG